MNKEQLQAAIADGKLERACVSFADQFGIPASDVAGFISLVLTFSPATKPRNNNEQNTETY